MTVFSLKKRVNLFNFYILGKLLKIKLIKSLSYTALLVIPYL